MGRIVVKVDGRKKRTNDSATSHSVFEKVRRERQEENRKLLDQYKKEINKVVHAR
ncbi:hypothetical protein [Niallia circulans]|jgi:hypothetical protein|uniref:hypothetical protein n=1 Tax=Niallia circulans TaxID=1397 RepID=UPI0015CC41D3|nr:hypothetical protein [Niallia circulans]